MMGSAVDRRSDSLLRMPEVRKRTGLSTASVYRKLAEKTFPPQVRLGPKMVAWYQSDIETFIQDPMGYRAGSA
jgi:prophage regulatory protein